MDMKSKVVVIGGHLTPALATIDELVARNAQIIFIGKPQGKSATDDRIEMDKRGIEFIGLETGKFHRHSILNALGSLTKVPGGFGAAWKILKENRPQVILSFGGYLSVPVVWAGWLQGIPSVIHEQTRQAGLANRINAVIAKKVALAFADSQRLFGGETVVIGNPMRQDVLSSTDDFGGNIKSPYIYVTGGHQGASIINQNMFAAINEIIKHTNIIHSIGVHEAADNDWLQAEKLMKQYPDKYLAKRYFAADEIGSIMKNARLIVSRAGANTCSEIAYLVKPCILIPIVAGKNNEQMENAKLLEKINLAEIIQQQELTSQLLVNKISYMLSNLKKYQGDRKEIEKLFPQDSAAKLAKITISLCEK